MIGCRDDQEADLLGGQETLRVGQRQSEGRPVDIDDPTGLGEVLRERGNGRFDLIPSHSRFHPWTFQTPDNPQRITVEEVSRSNARWMPDGAAAPKVEKPGPGHDDRGLGADCLPMV